MRHDLVASKDFSKRELKAMEAQDMVLVDSFERRDKRLYTVLDAYNEEFTGQRDYILGLVDANSFQEVYAYHIIRSFSDGTKYIEEWTDSSIEEVVNMIAEYGNFIPDGDKEHTIEDLIGISIEFVCEIDYESDSSC